jgi:hypothetical protein
MPTQPFPPGIFRNEQGCGCPILARFVRKGGIPRLLAMLLKIAFPTFPFQLPADKIPKFPDFSTTESSQSPL